MPLTLPTHPLAVVPLKLWRPRWFDGVALVVGSVSPDLPYALEGWFHVPGHAWHAPFWFSVPLTLVLCRLIRWCAAPVAANLPTGGPLRLRDYGALARVRHPVWITAGSALLGAYSHLLWDGVTHPTLSDGRIPIPPLRAEAFDGWQWWQLLSNGSDLLGVGVGTALVMWVGVTGLMRRWHGDPPPGPRRPVAFWAAVCAAVALCLPGLVYGPYAGSFPVAAIRVLWLVTAGLTAGAIAVRATARTAPAEPVPVTAVR